MSEWEMLLRVGIAAVLGGVIGFDREARHKPAGVRTHMLVGAGSALAVAASTLVLDDLRGVSGAGGDAVRVAAAVIAGMGFLGAGAIIRDSEGVRGLTTAAGIWVTAAVGIAAGYGLYILSIGATVITLVIVALLLYVPGPGDDGSSGS
jgi:putative Mg2+ transporter-C (MgtC) family protein